jgi:Tol biopolymer transport system component
VTWLGERLLFVSGALTRPSIMSLAGSGGVPESLTSPGLLPAASADGRSVVFVRDVFEGLWMADADGQHPRRLTTGFVTSAVVTPDNLHVIYLAGALGLGSNVRIVSVSGGLSSTLGREHADAVDVSPDGARLVVSTQQDQRRIMAICDMPDCTARRTLAIAANVVRWTPDGKHLAYVPSERPENLWTVDSEGGSPSQRTLFSDGRQIDDFAFSRASHDLAIIRSTEANNIVLLQGLPVRE